MKKPIKPMSKATITRKRNQLDKLAQAINSRDYYSIPKYVNKESLQTIISALKAEAVGGSLDTIPVLFEIARFFRDKYNRPFTVEEANNFYGLYITENHRGKMSGNASMNTDNKMNEFCKCYQQDEKKICHYCFAKKQLERQPSQEIPYIYNTILLRNFIIPTELLPMLNRLFFRFEAFGDLNNAIQLVNYNNLMKANRRTYFGFFTKNLFIIDNAIRNDGFKLAKNCDLVAGSFYLNEVRKLTDLQKTYVAHVFTVYEPEYLEAHPEIKINCGALHCMTCLQCYGYGTDFYINEIKK